MLSRLQSRLSMKKLNPGEGDSVMFNLKGKGNVAGTVNKRMGARVRIDHEGGSVWAELGDVTEVTEIRGARKGSVRRLSGVFGSRASPDKTYKSSAPEAKERDAPSEPLGCGDYQVDVMAPVFGTCKCGLPKAAHSFPASPPKTGKVSSSPSAKSKASAPSTPLSGGKSSSSPTGGASSGQKEGASPSSTGPPSDDLLTSPSAGNRASAKATVEPSIGEGSELPPPIPSNLDPGQVKPQVPAPPEQPSQSPPKAALSTPTPPRSPRSPRSPRLNIKVNYLPKTTDAPKVMEAPSRAMAPENRPLAVWHGVEIIMSPRPFDPQHSKTAAASAASEETPLLASSASEEPPHQDIVKPTGSSEEKPSLAVWHGIEVTMSPQPLTTHELTTESAAAVSAAAQSGGPEVLHGAAEVQEASPVQPPTSETATTVWVSVSNPQYVDTQRGVCLYDVTFGGSVVATAHGTARVVARKRFSDFTALRDRLCEAGAPHGEAVAAFPGFPKRQLLHGEQVLRERCAKFDAFMKTVVALVPLPKAVVEWICESAAPVAVVAAAETEAAPRAAAQAEPLLTPTGVPAGTEDEGSSSHSKLRPLARPSPLSSSSSSASSAYSSFLASVPRAGPTTALPEPAPEPAPPEPPLEPAEAWAALQALRTRHARATALLQRLARRQAYVHALATLQVRVAAWERGGNGGGGGGGDDRRRTAGTSGGASGTSGTSGGNSKSVWFVVEVASAASPVSPGVATRVRHRFSEFQDLKKALGCGLPPLDSPGGGSSGSNGNGSGNGRSGGRNGSGNGGLKWHHAAMELLSGEAALPPSALQARAARLEAFLQAAVDRFAVDRSPALRAFLGLPDFPPDGTVGGQEGGGGGGRGEGPGGDDAEAAAAAAAGLEVASYDSLEELVDAERRHRGLGGAPALEAHNKAEEADLEVVGEAWEQDEKPSSRHQPPVAAASSEAAAGALSSSPARDAEEALSAAAAAIMEALAQAAGAGAEIAAFAAGTYGAAAEAAAAVARPLSPAFNHDGNPSAAAAAAAAAEARAGGELPRRVLASDGEEEYDTEESAPKVAVKLAETQVAMEEQQQEQHQQQEQQQEQQQQQQQEQQQQQQQQQQEQQKQQQHEQQQEQQQHEQQHEQEQQEGGDDAVAKEAKVEMETKAKDEKETGTTGGKAPVVDVVGTRGCYLVAEEVMQGTLYLIWAEAPPAPKPGQAVLAFMAPSKPVPAFKFRAGGGKSELVRGVRGPLVKHYYRGWVEFVKLAREWGGELTLLPAADDVALHVNHGESLAVTKVAPGVPTSLAGVVGVAAGPRHTMTFQVNTMAPSLFLNKGHAEGGSVRFYEKSPEKKGSNV